MIFHENHILFHDNRLLADESQEISYLIFFQRLGKMSTNLLSAAVVIGALWVNLQHCSCEQYVFQSDWKTMWNGS